MKGGHQLQACATETNYVDDPIYSTKM